MSSPRFSILLPTHNRADVLPFAIRSALSQTEADFELLIAGDGCTDGTAEVVGAFDDSRIRWFDLRKATGVGYANRNVALREARGRHIAYLAHDDLWFHDHLARIGAALESAGVEFAHSRCLTVGIDGRILPSFFNLDVPGHREAMRRGESEITMCAVAHTRACLEKYGYWDETLARSGDKEMWSRILTGGRFENFAFLSEPTSLHFVADWRRTRAHAARTRAATWLVGGFLDAASPDVLRLVTPRGMTQQQAAWDSLAKTPEAAAARFRQAHAQFQDTLLWKARTPAGLVGLRWGLAAGRSLERVARIALRMLSRQRREAARNLRRKLDQP